MRTMVRATTPSRNGTTQKSPSIHHGISTANDSEKFFDHPSASAYPQARRHLARDPRRVVDGRAQVGRGQRVLSRAVGLRVALADDPPALHPAAADQGAVAIGVVLAAGLVVDLRRPAELADREDEG